MTMTKLQKEIIRAIIMAQISSDAGKGMHRVFLPGGQYAARKGYRAKEFYELRALTMVDSTPKCGINYWVEATPDQNGIDSILVYFDIRICEKRFQISFHNPAWSSIRSYVGKGRKTRWTHEYYGSVDACRTLARMIAE